MTVQQSLHRILLAVLGLWLVGAVADTASAQYYDGASSVRPMSASRRVLSQPAVSPYLQLLSSSSNNLPTYYTRVRPEIEARELEQRATRELQSLQGQVRSLRQDESRGGLGTGHPTRYMNYSHYYPGLPSR